MSEPGKKNAQDSQRAEEELLVALLKKKGPMSARELDREFRAAGVRDGAFPAFSRAVRAGKITVNHDFQVVLDETEKH